MHEVTKESIEMESLIIDKERPTHHSGNNPKITKKNLRFKLFVAIGSGLCLFFVSYIRLVSEGETESTELATTTKTDTFSHHYNVSEFLHAVEKIPSFCGGNFDDDRSQIENKKVNCECKNPLKPSRPPKGTPYGDQWNIAFTRNMNLANDQAQNPIVVFLGDSITEHFLGTELSVTDLNEKGNAVVFTEFFGKDKQFPGLALGIAGDRCNNLLYRLQNGELTTRLNPKIFWILVGTNDLGEDDCSATSIAAGVLKVVQEVQEQRPDTVIVVNSLLPRSTSVENGKLDYSSTYWPTIQSVNHMLESYINKGETYANDVHWFDATSLFVLDSNNDKAIMMNKSLMPDLLHPSTDGSRLWCREIYQTIERLVGR